MDEMSKLALRGGIGRAYDVLIEEEKVWKKELN